MSMTEPRSPLTSLGWRARIRDREVEVRWDGGRFSGDLEVLARLARLEHLGDAATPEGARALIGCALLDPVEVPLPEELEVRDPATGHAESVSSDR
jgi:hypothetical protein